MSELAVTHGQAIHAPDPRVDADGVVIAEVPCIGCGYNLRSLSRDANCPECGKAAVDSLRHDDLTLADPAWLKQMASGTQRVGLAMLAVPVLVVAGFVFGLFIGLALTMMLSIAWPWVGVVAAIGYWRIATAEPGVLAQKGYRSRLVLRGLAVILGLMSVGCVLVTGLAWFSGGEMFYMVVFVFVLMAAVLQVPAIVLVELRVHGLLLRAPRDRRLKQTRWVLRGFAATLAVWLVALVTLVILAGISVSVAFGGGGRAPFVDMALSIVGILQFVLTLVLAVGLVWSGVLLLLHAKLFREVRTMAIMRATQTAEAASPTEAGEHGHDANQS